MIFDTHAHYYSEEYDVDRTLVLSTLREKGVGYVINCGCDVEATKKCLKMAEDYDFLYASSGFHPGHIEFYEEDTLSKIEELSFHEKCVAIGEIGLDYHYGKEYKEEQKVIFSEQIKIANRRNLPIIVHEREAFSDCMEILKREKPKSGVMHSFSGNKVTLFEVLDLGMYIGVGGMLTFKNNVKTVEMCPLIPKDRLLLETDCPYLSPTPMRGKRNHSVYINYVADKVAELWGKDREYVLDVSLENAKRLFGIK